MASTVSADTRHTGYRQALLPNQEFLEALLDILALILNVLDSNGDLKDLPNLPDHRSGLGEQAGAATSPAQKLLSNVKR